MNQHIKKAAILLIAAFFTLTGIAFVVAPIEMTARLFNTNRLQMVSPVLPSLLGAAFLGVAIMNWLIRNAPLGGIYGRAIVSGNQVHFFAGTLILITSNAVKTATILYGVLLSVYLLSAIFFTLLLFFNPKNSTG